VLGRWQSSPRKVNVEEKNRETVTHGRAVAYARPVARGARSAILTRRAAFVAATLSTLSAGGLGCQEATPAKPIASTPPEDAGGKAQPCLSIVQGPIQFSQKIYFEKDQDSVRPVSFDVLDAVATTLKQHPEIELELAGHTDATEDPSIAESRAKAVRAYLVSKGIDTLRLRIKGYGSAMPSDTNSTASGRERNRRVEFQRSDPVP